MTDPKTTENADHVTDSELAAFERALDLTDADSEDSFDDGDIDGDDEDGDEDINDFDGNPVDVE